jgi:hypothetical protein
LASTIWARWRSSEGETSVGGTSTVRSERMGRTRSDMPILGGTNVRTNGSGEEDTQSEIVDSRGGSWGRNRGYSVV